MMHESSEPGSGNIAASGGGRFSPRLIGLAIAVAVAVSFFFQNGGRTRIWFLLFSFTSKTRTAILVAIALGVVLDRVFISWWGRRKAAGKTG